MANIFDQVYQDLMEQQAANLQTPTEGQIESYPMRPGAWEDIQRRSAQYGAGTPPDAEITEAPAPPAYQANIAPQRAPAAASGALGNLPDVNAQFRLAQQLAQQKQQMGQAYLNQLEQQYQQQAAQTGPSKWEQAAALLQVAGALSQPTRSGSLFESLGAAGTAAAGPLQKMGEAEQKRRDALNQLQLARAKMAYEMAGVGSPDINTMVQLSNLELAQRKQAAAEKEEPTYREIKLPGMDPITVKIVGGKTFTLDDKPLNVEELTRTSRGGEQDARRAEAIATGVPLAPRNWISQLSEKNRAGAIQKVMTESTKTLDKEEASLETAKLDIQDAKRFMELNRQLGWYEQGKFLGKGPAWFSSAADEADKIQTRLSTRIKQPGDGSVSDFERKIFANATLSRSAASPVVNENIANGMIASKQNQIDYNAFKRAYLETNTTLQYAKQYWDQYLKDNPIFDPRSYTVGEDGSIKDTTRLRLNPNRESWQDYFRRKMSAQQPGSTQFPAEMGQQGRPVNIPDGVTQQDIINEIARKRRAAEGAR